MIIVMALFFHLFIAEVLIGEKPPVHLRGMEEMAETTDENFPECLHQSDEERRHCILEEIGKIKPE